MSSVEKSGLRLSSDSALTWPHRSCGHPRRGDKIRDPQLQDGMIRLAIGSDTPQQAS